MALLGFSLLPSSGADGGNTHRKISKPRIKRGAHSEAKSIYDASKGLVFQIKTAFSADSPKATYGSAFVVDAHGLLATNYHVVQEAVHNPRLKIFITEPGLSKAHEAKILGIDVINDLAIVQIGKRFEHAISIRRAGVTTGERTYSLGIPRDLTMSIIEGVYNGTKGNKSYQRMVLSTPLNSGMSGGPTLDPSGQLVGVNVAVMTESNSLSFAIPVEHLQRLHREVSQNRVPASSVRWKDVIAQQLSVTQERNTDEILDQSSLQEFSFSNWKFSVTTESLSCWRKEERNMRIGATVDMSQCFAPFDSMIETDVRTASYWIRMLHIRADQTSKSVSLSEKNKIISLDSIKAITGENAYRHYAGASCDSSVVVNAKQVALQVSYCITGYRHYKDLFNVYLQGVTIGGAKDDTFAVQMSFKGFKDKSIKQIAQALLDRIERSTP